MIPLPELATLLLPFRTPSPNGIPPLRVGVVLDQDRPAPWVDALLIFLRRLPGIDVPVITVTYHGRPAAKAPGWLAGRLYSMSRAKFDPFGDLGSTGNGSISPESFNAIRSAGCGLILWLAPPAPSRAVPRGLAEHGVLTVQLGDRPQAIPFWNEVAGNQVTSATTIFWHDESLAQGRMVRQAETSTVQGLYVTANAEQPLCAAVRMLAALCLEVQREGRRFVDRVRTLAVQSLAGAAPLESPSNLQAATFAASKLLRSAQLRWTTRGKALQWFIALRPNRGESITGSTPPDMSGFTDIPLPAGVEAIADPFVWQTGGANYLLFEELAKGQSRGRLGCVELLPDGNCSEMKIILDRPYHLSYPCVVPDNGDLFLLPETAQANRIDLYRFSRFPWEMELVASPVEGVPLVDTTPIHIDGHWYFFTTTTEPFMETFLFSAARLEGPWTLHPCNPVSASVKNCRSAGHLFWRDGRLFRPTQDCSVRYGYAIAVNEVTTLTPHEFAERPAGYLPPTWRPGLLGTHTWNESPAYQVADGIRYAQ